MQKKIIALAIAAAASSAAFAQSNVTLYGVVDASEGIFKSTGGYEGNGYAFGPAASAAGSAVAYANQKNVNRLDSNSSYIGLKGVEDLGDGLKAIFQYETGFANDTNVGLAGGRDSFVGLTGGFGTVVAGVLTHPLRNMMAKTELAAGATGFGTMSSVYGQVAGIATGADDRSKNTVAYVTPTFSGLNATVAFINGGSNGTELNDGSKNPKAWQVAAQYENGPLWAAIGYHKAQDVAANVSNVYKASAVDVNGVPTGDLVGLTGATAATANKNASIFRVAAVYTLPTQTKLTVLVDRTKIDALGFSGSTLVANRVADPAELKRTAWSIGIAQPFGKHTVGLEYGQAQKLKVEGDSIDETGAKIVTALYSYELSKRTSVYARASKLNNGDLVNNNFYVNPVSNGATTGFGASYTGYAAGLRHNF